MGQLIDGRWVSENIISNHDKAGLYYKRDSVFRNRIERESNSEFPAVPGRYHLYCAVACPWAHRATLMRTLKKLEPFVTLTNTFQEPGGQGWSFGEQGHIVPGTDRRLRWLHELYAIADPACTTRVTVPTLWDAKTRRVVNNESSEILRMFNVAFSEIADPSPDYYPGPLRQEIDETNTLVLKGVNNAVNGCGYSISQEAYDSSVKLLFGTLDGLEQRLSTQRYLCGHTPGIADVCDVAGMKRGVFSKAGPVGSNGIVPVGPAIDYSRPHDRGRFAREQRGLHRAHA
jgi:putative glutathione S-transferase